MKTPGRDNAVGIDHDRNNVQDTLFHCSTFEGIKFSIWASSPFRSAKLWSDYYYLGYDVEADCPVTESKF